VRVISTNRHGEELSTPRTRDSVKITAHRVPVGGARASVVLVQGKQGLESVIATYLGPPRCRPLKPSLPMKMWHWPLPASLITQGPRPRFRTSREDRVYHEPETSRVSRLGVGWRCKNATYAKPLSQVRQRQRYTPRPRQKLLRLRGGYRRERSLGIAP
jgi:hypothetical protein